MNIDFTFNSNVNISLQVGDRVYYCPTDNSGGFQTVNNTLLPSTGIVYLGDCTGIDRNVDLTVIRVLVDPTLPVPQQTSLASGVGLGDFLMFSKNTQANRSSLLGYYAATTFRNNSPSKAELFAASTECSESSK